MKQWKYDTRVVHADKWKENDKYRSHVMPIYQTSTFTFDSIEDGRKLFAGEEGGASHTYSRIANPTVQALEASLVTLEDSDNRQLEGLVFASGMSAITTAVISMSGNGQVVAQKTLYGCTSQFFTREAAKFAFEVKLLDDSSTDIFLEELFNMDRVDLIYLESIANPTQRVLDISRIIKAAHEIGAKVLIDNTFATPYHFKAFHHDVDAVVYSTTKYLSGHGTVVGGALIFDNEKVDSEDLHLLRKNLGGIAGPFDAWLTINGVKTFSLRMERHSTNAIKVAQFLVNHPKVDSVEFPGLIEHPNYELANRLFVNGFGGVIALHVKGGYKEAAQLMDNVELCTRAVSLGHPDTLIQHPASMTHSVMDKSVRLDSGISDNLVRIAVGLEDADDIIHDLNQALNRISNGVKHYESI